MFSFVGIIFVFLGWVLIPTSNLSFDDLGFFVYKVGPEPIFINGVLTYNLYKWPKIYEYLGWNNPTYNF